MKKKKQLISRWFYGGALLVILFGFLISAWIFTDSGIWKYPAMIENAFSGDQFRLNVPGAKDLKLTRSGAYGIYYEYSLVSSSVDNLIIPPAIDCSLTSKSTGGETQAVPDYVETNRYWSKDKSDSGVLIMSITVNEPDTYTFACHYQDARTGPEITVTIGPNYVWEFFRAAGKFSLGLIGATGTLCGSILIGLIIIIVVAIKRRE